jgi:hypothetical protein
VVDGNLSKDRVDGSDGELVTDALRYVGGIVIIGFSGSGEVRGADINVQKGDFSQFGEVLRAIQNIEL